MLTISKKNILYTIATKYGNLSTKIDQTNLASFCNNLGIGIFDLFLTSCVGGMWSVIAWMLCGSFIQSQLTHPSNYLIFLIFSTLVILWTVVLLLNLIIFIISVCTGIIVWQCNLYQAIGKGWQKILNIDELHWLENVDVKFKQGE